MYGLLPYTIATWLVPLYSSLIGSPVSTSGKIENVSSQIDFLQNCIKKNNLTILLSLILNLLKSLSPENFCFL